MVKVQDLRYGENPHQRAAFYREPLAGGSAVTAAKQLQGKELSFNNILDIDAALGLAAEFEQCACAIIKHGNPCGAALGADPAAAYERALACDPMSAFGGVIAYNRTVDERAARAMAEHFFEAIIAPAFDPEAQAALKRKKKLRLLELADLASFRRSGFDLRRVQEIGFSVNVYERWCGAGEKGRTWSCNKGVGRGDHLVTWPDTQGAECDLERRSAAGDAERPLGADKL